MAVESSQQWADNGQGWELSLVRHADPALLDADRRPVVLVPGYGMNTFIFDWHPQGQSMVKTLAEAGFEVWTAELRSQGRSRTLCPDAAAPTLLAYAEEDLPAVVDHVLAHTRTRTDKVTLVGASLGGTLTYLYVGLHTHHRVGGVIAIGTPMRWVDRHPLVRLGFVSRRLAGAVPLHGIRELARYGLPLLLRMPWALAMYMNADHVDPAHASILSRGVDDPHSLLNRDLATWMKRRDLRARQHDLAAALAEVDLPLLAIYANRDGVVPPTTARSVQEVWGGPIELLEVGTDDDWYAHADLFIAPDSPTEVFAPMVDWLRRH